MATVSTSFTATGISASLHVTARGENISVALSGTYAATVQLEKSGSGSAWSRVGGPWSTANATVAFVYNHAEDRALYRLRCTSFTSGTVVTTVGDGDKIIDPSGSDSRFTRTQAGLTEHGTLTVDSTLAVTGAVTMSGDVIMRPTDGTPILRAIPAPVADSTTGTSMTEAILLSGIHVKTPTAAQNYQVPKGAEISTAVGALTTLAVGDSFDWTLINLGGTGDDITLTVDTGTTFVGDVVLRPIANTATEQAGQGTWRFRNTAANTWIGYRVA